MTQEGKILNNLSSKKSTGHEGISTSLPKSVKSVVLKLLTYIVNQTILTGIFPDQLKIAEVTPLSRKGDACLFNTYIPISCLDTHFIRNNSDLVD